MIKSWTDEAWYDDIKEISSSIGHEENHIYRYILEPKYYLDERTKGVRDDLPTLEAIKKFKIDEQDASYYGLTPEKIYQAMLIVNEDEYKAMEFENKVEKKVGMDSKRDIYNINIKVINGKLYLREAEWFWNVQL